MGSTIDPAEYRAKARECLAEVEQLRSTREGLRRATEQVFRHWKGIAATSLNKIIHDQLEIISKAEHDLRRAADVLNKAARDEERRREQERLAMEAERRWLEGKLRRPVR